MTDTTTLPTRVIGSFGPTKSNAYPTVDYTHEIDADEYNAVADWALANATVLGVTGGSPARDSHRDRLDWLGGDPVSQFRWIDHFHQYSNLTTTIAPHWATTGTVAYQPAATSATTSGFIRLRMDGGTIKHYNTDFVKIKAIAAVSPEVRVRWLCSDYGNSGEFRVGLLGDTDTEWWAIRLDGAGTIKLCNKEAGGAEDLQAFAFTPNVGYWYNAAITVDYTAGTTTARIYTDDETTVDETQVLTCVPTEDGLRPFAETTAGLNTQYLYLDFMWVGMDGRQVI